MAKTNKASTGANVAQLRDDIDGGRTRDKVAAADPATVPLGTDAEAGGARNDAHLVAEARRVEGTRGGTTGGPATRPGAGTRAGHDATKTRRLVIGSAAAIVVVAVVVLLLV